MKRKKDQSTFLIGRLTIWEKTLIIRRDQKAIRKTFLESLRKGDSG